MKYLFVSGGVISGVGKGIASSSIGTLLKSRGHVVTHFKIDPYMNQSARYMNPHEHGEVYILDDGYECDMDFGTYERFSGVKLSSINSVTGGNLFYEMLKKEMEGGFHGKTLQINPHMIDEVIRRIQDVADTPVESFSGGETRMADVVIIELGGTIGEYESLMYTEAFSKFQYIVGRENCAFVSVDYLIELESGEQKTKVIQTGCKNFKSFGLTYDIIICRSKSSLSDVSRKKISWSCLVKEENIFDLPTLGSVYEVPRYLEKQGIIESLNCILGIENKVMNMRMLETFDKLSIKNEEKVVVGIVGKYSSMLDSYVSVLHGLKFSGSSLGIDVEIKWIDAECLEGEGENELNKCSELDSCDGIIIPGGFGSRGVSGKLVAIRYCRERMIPLLGICFGYQLSIIEMCKNILGMSDACSEEFLSEEMESSSGMSLCDEKNLVIRYIGSVEDKELRVGGYDVELVEDGLVSRLYGQKIVRERHRHRYEVVQDRVKDLESHGVRFVGRSIDGRITKVFELNNHPFFVGVQFHPEFIARPERPHPLFTGFLSSCHSGVNDNI